MREWLLTAADCSCASLDVCALFEPRGDHAPESLRATHGGAVAPHG